ncbi:hypothetical protein ABT369_06275 [Dactylosporangium sp. NPDC000244]|uniref:hypothetical protein n=1 Tax=Dactylosporangium sp. NPDC000244 TaxID=3154365 RepID=UPI00333147BD
MYTVSLIGTTPFPRIAGGGFALWRYRVDIDHPAHGGPIGLGFGTAVDIRDPSAFPDVAQLRGTRLLRPGGEAAALQFVVHDADDLSDGSLEIAFVAPAVQDRFTAAALVTLSGTDAEHPRFLNYRTQPSGPDNVVQALTGPAVAAAAPAPQPAGEPAGAEPNKGVLPYASELFGVYQPLVGWRSTLQHEHLAEATSSRFRQAARLVDPAMFEPPAPSPATPPAEPRGPVVRLAPEQEDERTVAINLREGLVLDPGIRPGTAPAPAPAPVREEGAAGALLQYLRRTSPQTVQQMLTPKVPAWQRVLAAATWFAEDHPARSAFLSPIGLLHMFREYFFEIGTFLGPPVGHVWISPGGQVELVEVNTRRQLVERTVEQSVETTTKTEVAQTDQDELSDAVKVENANDTRLGVTASASGGVAGIFQASGSGSFNLDSSRKQAQEQTHKRMREQSSKLSSEVRQNYKTTFRTVTETTDTSSRRYLLQNTTDRLVSYQLSRKMRKVAVQVQDLGEQLCWQLYIDNPGDPLGLGEFVHATSSALDPGVKVPDYKPYPANIEKTHSLAIPFILYQGADDEAENTYELSGDNADHGIFKPDAGKDDIIQFKFEFKCPPPPAGFVLNGISSLDFHGAQVNFNVDPPDVKNNSFVVHLTHASFGGRPAIPFDANLVYAPTPEARAAIDRANADLKTAYDDEVALKKEQLFYDTLRSRLKLVSQVRPRPQEDLRAEERSIVYRSLIKRLYGNENGWSNEDYHVASELIRYLFDVDSMLYFVAPDWWRPREQRLATKDDQGELQPTIIAEPALSDRVAGIGKGRPRVIPGHRPYYLITEETAPAPQGASLGWLIQLDGDVHRNAFLNSPWVKAVLPIRPGREREAMAWLRRPEVAGSDGLDEPYPFDATQDPPEYRGQSIGQVLLLIADRIRAEHEASLTPVPADPGRVGSALTLPTETVFSKGFDPLEGGIKFGAAPFAVFSQWMEILPTDQVVATEYTVP